MNTTILGVLIGLGVFVGHFSYANSKLNNELEDMRKYYIDTINHYSAVSEQHVELSNTVLDPSKWVMTGCEQYIPLLEQYFGDSAGIAFEVMKAESKCNSEAIGDTHITFVRNGVTYGMSCGLFQIRYLEDRPGCITDVEENIAYAASLYEARGWQPWSVCKNGLVECGL